MVRIHSVVPIQNNNKSKEKTLPTLDHPVQEAVIKIHPVVLTPSNKIYKRKALHTLDHPVQEAVIDKVKMTVYVI
ncbi:hypothetical protein CWB66_05320 [Pseudoalteromonas sp. S558]|nr:hypothetical protein CWB66_05320 [Pseudoalteromonas sp. S558]